MTLRLDLAATPFSRRGCWTSLAYPRKPEHQPLGPGLYLRTNHGRPIVPREIARLEPLVDGQPASHSVSSDGSGIDIAVAGGGRIAIICAGSGSVRISGTGCAMRLDVVAGPLARQPMPTVVYALRPGAWALNMRGALRRYAVVPLRGGLRCTATWEGERTVGASITTEGDRWEVLIEEFQTVWHATTLPSFAAERAAARRALMTFIRGLPPVPRAAQQARALAGYLLWSCTKSPSGNLGREAVFMSLNWMDGVWSWDNLFNLVAIASTDPDLAFAQIALEADHQDPSGAYPDFLGDLYKHYCFHKPPVHGLLLGYLHRIEPAWFTAARRRLIVASVGRYTRFWLDHRRWEGDALAYYLHGNDSGWDNSTILLHGAPLVAPDLNAFLIMQCRFLAALTRGAEARAWTAEADRIEDALLRLWDGDRFVGEHLPEHRRIRCESLVDCMPVVLGRRLPKDVAAGLVERIRGFLAPAGLATERLDSPHYTEDGYWRGPVWGPATVLIWLGLRDLGETDLAEEVARRYCATCIQSGFAENFHATTGVGLRDPGYTWTASAFLILAGGPPSRRTAAARAPRT